MKDVVTACPVEDVMRVLRGRWRSLLLYYLVNGPKRFSDLQRDLPGISQRMLTLDLRELEAEGLVARTVYPEAPPRVEYALTDDGERILGLLNALGDHWADMRARRKAMAA